LRSPFEAVCWPCQLAAAAARGCPEPNGRDQTPRRSWRLGERLPAASRMVQQPLIGDSACWISFESRCRIPAHVPRFTLLKGDWEIAIVRRPVEFERLPLSRPLASYPSRRARLVSIIGQLSSKGRTRTRLSSLLLINAWELSSPSIRIGCKSTSGSQWIVKARSGG
jgi:hypothetical protein